jgi:nucleoid DNA-binding protein
MITQQLIKQSYQIVQQDLLNTFTKMKKGERIRLPNIGVFEKKFRKGKSCLPESFGKKYASY